MCPLVLTHHHHLLVESSANCGADDASHLNAIEVMWLLETIVEVWGVDGVRNMLGGEARSFGPCALPVDILKSAGELFLPVARDRCVLCHSLLGAPVSPSDDELKGDGGERGATGEPRYEAVGVKVVGIGVPGIFARRCVHSY